MKQELLIKEYGACGTVGVVKVTHDLAGVSFYAGPIKPHSFRMGEWVLADDYHDNFFRTENEALEAFLTKI